VLGGLLQTGLALIPSDRFAGFAAPVVGASAGAFGLVAAYATLFPERPLTLLVFFIIPVSLRAKFLLLFEGIVAAAGMLMQISHNPARASDNVANAAHLGGMLAGILFIRYAMNWQLPEFRLGRGPYPRRLVKVHAEKSAPWGRSKESPVEDLPPEEFLSKEVDPILDKISAHGIQSLNERERRILEAARKKMGKR
jgi:hypothetical protein